MGLPSTNNKYAVLDQDFSFTPSLQYFLQVKLNMDSNGRVVATPFEGNGSGDFANFGRSGCIYGTSVGTK